MSDKRSLLILCASFLLAVGVRAQEAAWELKSKDELMELYTRKPDGSRLVEVRIRMNLKARPKDLLAVLDDLATYPRWVYRCSSARRVGASKGYYYQSIVDLPFPFSDRDVVAQVQQRTDSRTGKTTRTVRATPDIIPGEKGMERIKTYEAVWEIQSVSDTHILIDYRCFTDTGGSLPSWIVNEVATSGPVKSMRRLAELVQK